MLRNDTCKKALVIGIIVLFIGMSVVPSTGRIIKSDDTSSPEFINFSMDISKYNESALVYFSVELNGTCGCERVEMYINGGLCKIICGPGPEYVFVLEWVEGFFNNVMITFSCSDEEIELNVYFQEFRGFLFGKIENFDYRIYRIKFDVVNLTAFRFIPILYKRYFTNEFVILYDTSFFSFININIFSYSKVIVGKIIDNEFNL